VTHAPTPGRSLVTRRAIRDLVRTAALAAYGVTGFAGGGPLGRLLARAGVGSPGLRIELGPELVVDLRLTVAYGLPVAEVARQVESSVRYTLRHALGREPDLVRIRIGRLEHQRATAPSPAPAAAQPGPGPAELAASGSDVA
jgi:uncharacterized alkaline shock family protein YloU